MGRTGGGFLVGADIKGEEKIPFWGEKVRAKGHTVPPGGAKVQWPQKRGRPSAPGKEGLQDRTHDAHRDHTAAGVGLHRLHPAAGPAAPGQPERPGGGHPRLRPAGGVGRHERHPAHPAGGRRPAHPPAAGQPALAARRRVEERPVQK